MINEEKLKKFLRKWIQIPDEIANQCMNDDLEEVFE